MFKLYADVHPEQVVRRFLVLFAQVQMNAVVAGEDIVVVHIRKGRITAYGTGVFGEGVVALSEGQKVPQEDVTNGARQT